MLVLFLILSNGTVLLGQNLVPNPSFEDYGRLPCGVNEFLIQDLLRNWMQPTPATTDYWNSLAEPDCFLNPTESTVVPRTGNGMVGLITAVIQNGIKRQYKEYVEVKLVDSLKKGALYHVELYAHNRLKSITQSDILSANNLGVAFSDTPVLYPNNASAPDHLLLESPVRAEEPVGSSWEKIEGCFLAPRTSQYLLIGNFQSIDSTTLVQITSGSAVANAYYFIDDILVEELPYDVSALVTSVTLCEGQESVELNAYVPGATDYQWEDGTSSSTLSVTEKSTETYGVQITFDECQYMHSFDVAFFPALELGADTTLCSGEVLILDPKYSFGELQWSDGVSSSEKTITATGTYSVTVPKANCMLGDDINVSFVDCPGFIPNIITPNDDAFNEYFEVENIEVRPWSLKVFNKWGERVFYSAQYQNDWSGAGLGNGVYYYILSSAELAREIKGWIQLSY